MKRILGLVLFSIGIGMLLMIFLPVCVISVCAILGIMIIGYNLFAC